MNASNLAKEACGPSNVHGKMLIYFTDGKEDEKVGEGSNGLEIPF